MAQDVRSDDAPSAQSKHDAAERVSAELIDPKGGAVSAQAVTINRSPGEVYAFFRDFANLPSVMENLERIDVIDAMRSHWVVKAPAGKTVEWNAVVTRDEQDRLIEWTSADGADIANRGRVEFSDAGARGTVVTATILYDPPGGVIGKFVAKLFQREPAMQSRRDLKRLKQLLETGEIATAARTRAEYVKQEG